MTSRTLFTGNFPELQARFIADVTAERKRDPLAELDVVVSGKLARLSLRRDLAREGGSHANVRFWTLGELARAAAEPAMRERGLQTLADVAFGPLMLAAVQECGSLRYFAEIADRPGFHRALWRTLGELRGAGITLDQLRRAETRLRASSHRTLHAKLADLATIWSALHGKMERAGFVDSHGLLELAIAHAETDPRVPVILYGLDDLSVLEQRFLERIIQDRPCAVYLPCSATPAFEWTRPLRDYCLALGFREQALLPDSAAHPTALARLQHGLFDDAASHVEVSGDDSVLILSAPGRPREVEEILREVVHSPLASALPARRVGILLRESEPYSPLLRQELARAGLTGFVVRTLADTEAGRALSLFLPLLGGEFRRADVMEFLLSAPVRFPESLDGDGHPIPAAQWNHFSLLAGIVAGEAAWEDALRRLYHHLNAQRRRNAAENDDAPSSDDALSSLSSMRVFLPALFARIREMNSTTAWKTRVERLTELFQDIIGDAEGFSALRERLDHAESLDRLNLPATTEQFAAALRTILDSPVSRDGRFQHDEPSVVTYREATGARFDEVLLPGVVEKEIPRGASLDPLLLNDERRALTELGILSLPERDRQREREMFLFAAAISSANRRLVLSFPRREAEKSRERLPSSYLLRVSECLTGRRVSYSEMEEIVRASPFARRIPTGRLQPCDSLRSVTDFDYDVSRLAEALRASSSDPVADLAADHPFFARSALAEKQRFRRIGFSRFDGLVEDESLRRRLAANRNAPVSPTRFENYARCPFQFFIRYMLGLEEIEEPSAIRQLRHLERGLLMHDILERFFRAEGEAGRLPLNDDAADRMSALAAQMLRRYANEETFGLPLLWTIAQEEMTADLVEFVRQERDETTRFVPAHFEVSYGMSGGVAPSTDEPLRVGLRDGREVFFHGRIDRIDVDPDGPARVVDYKSGKPTPGLADGRLCGGRALQLPVYRLAAESLMGCEVSAAEYRYLTSDAKKSRIGYTIEHWHAAKDAFLLAVTTIHDGISCGRFFPFPEDRKCGSCFARFACGAGRATLKWNEPSAETESFRTLAEQIP